ncbi:MAG: ADP-ribosylglycohydrolase [Methanoregula sp. PtaU1.Bin006]|nr:MAG: ADP-ribosylglycohydrolase [Methanoregula sp. PtaB.Bin085]OPY35037.1 MAG: ADP-ribosylglycohydrolase [Methanoregula sp. PtaU1.Bin006]
MRHVGSLVALAIGDALGAPLEGSRKPERWLAEYRPGGRHFRKKGDVTDDTLQAEAIAESLVACRGFCENDVVEKLSCSYIQKPEWFGPTSSLFFDLVRSGTVPHRAARIVHRRRGGSRTNGSVMRGFPLAIFYPAPQVYGVSVTCSQLTHHDPVAGHCSAFLNAMVSDMVRGQSRAYAFRHARSLCTNPEVHEVLANYNEHRPDPSLDSVLCSHAALYSFMHAKSAEMAILSAVNMGGDADTVGACTGALAGAYWGLEALPRRWLAGLEKYDELVQLAERVWELRADR